MAAGGIDLSQLNVHIQPVYKYVGCVAIIAVVLLVFAVLYRRQLQENFKLPVLNESPLCEDPKQKIPNPPPVTPEEVATTFAKNHDSFVSYLHALDKSLERIDEKYRDLDFWLLHRNDERDKNDADAIGSDELDINKTV